MEAKDQDMKEESREAQEELTDEKTVPLKESESQKLARERGQA